MDISNNVGSSFGATDIMSQLKGNDISSDGFIKLLLTQLKMQSPTSPFDSSTMMQQISQLTSLSSTKELQKTVQDLQTTFGMTQAIEASHLVGKHVQVSSDKAMLTKDSGLNGSVIVPPGIDKISLTISDANDNVVKTIELNSSNEGSVDFHWDGYDKNNKLQSEGFYNLAANVTINGEAVSVPTAGSFAVNSVAFDKDSSGIIINVDGLGGLSMKDIIKII